MSSRWLYTRLLWLSRSLLNELLWMHHRDGATRRLSRCKCPCRGSTRQRGSCHSWLDSQQCGTRRLALFQRASERSKQRGAQNFASCRDISPPMLPTLDLGLILVPKARTAEACPESSVGAAVAAMKPAGAQKQAPAGSVLAVEHVAEEECRS